MWINSQYLSDHLKNLNNYAISLSNKLVGHEMIYIRRDKVVIDHVFSEVEKSVLKDTFKFKGILNLDRSFDTGGALLSKFGLQNDLELIFTISQVDFDKFKLESENGDFTDLIRPMEGDLIYFPYNDNMWQITFCDNRPTSSYKYNPTLLWEITCQLYEQTNDDIVTGNVDLDKFDSDNIGTVFSMTFTVMPFDQTMKLKVGELVHIDEIQTDGSSLPVWTAEVVSWNASTQKLVVKNVNGAFDSMQVLYSEDTKSMFTIMSVDETQVIDERTKASMQNNEFDALDSKILSASNHNLGTFTGDVGSSSGTNKIQSQAVIDAANANIAANNIKRQQSAINKINTSTTTIHENDFDSTNPFGGN